MIDWKPVELFKLGVMRSYFLLRAINRVAEFCTFGKRSLKNLGGPFNKELELIKEWTKVSVSDIDKQSLISGKLRQKKTLLLLLFGCIWLKGEIDLCIVWIKVEVKLMAFDDVSKRRGVQQFQFSVFFFQFLVSASTGAKRIKKLNL